MTVRFNAKDHTYHADDGRVVPGVSTILAGAGVVAPYRGPESAGRRGTWVHRATELVDEGVFDWEVAETTAPEWIGYVKAYRTFITDNPVTVIASEEIVSNEKLWYAGTLDRRLKVHGRLGVWDIKTSSSPASWHLVQAIAYRLTFPESEFYQVRVLYLRKDGSYRVAGNAKAEEVARAAWADAHRKWKEAYPWSSAG